MIAVQQALHLIDKHVQSNTFDQVNIVDAHGCVLAQDVFSDIDLPPFRQSAMDGFAVRDWEDAEFTVIGEIQAGSQKEIPLKKGEALRIYTGARVPSDADRVIMKEHVEDLGSFIRVLKFQQKTNIKGQGEQLKKGDIALCKGEQLNTAALSFLAGLGINEIYVVKRPSIAVLISGNELLQPGDTWQQAKSYDSNSFILKLLLKQLAIEDISLHYVTDDKKACIATVEGLLNKHDFVIATGGISVGDYDLMRIAFDANQVEEQFYKINQKPGKPIYFGIKGKKVIFGLPGNPAACFINFQIYVMAALRRISGKSSLNFKTGICDQKIENSSSKAMFLRGKCVDGHLRVFDNQSSSLLSSLIEANVLVYIPEDVELIEIGDEVQYLDIVQ